MGQKALFELLVRRLAGHFRERLHQLFLGVIDVLQLMGEQVVHGLDVAGKESHRFKSFSFWGTQSRAFVCHPRRYVRLPLRSANGREWLMFLAGAKTPRLGTSHWRSKRPRPFGL